MAALGLCCYAGAFSSCGERGLLFVAVLGLLLLRSMGSRLTGFSSCGSRALEHSLTSCDTQAWLLRGMWDLPGSGLKPVSPPLAGGFLTTVSPGKSRTFKYIFSSQLVETFTGTPLPTIRHILLYSCKMLF